MAVATACANIALVKYWGKRDAALNLPAAGSLSLALDRLRTYTQVERIDGDTDELVLDGVQVDGKALARISKFVDLVRDTGAVRVTSLNTFPTAAGLASSASAFAALAVATAEAFDKALSPTELSVLARRGSGSAARSIFDGWAKMNAGVAEDGHDAAAEPVAIDLELCAERLEADQAGRDPRRAGRSRCVHEGGGAVTHGGARHDQCVTRLADHHRRGGRQVGGGRRGE